MTISEFRDQFFALTDAAKRIVITSHLSPDDDSIGSVLSMYALLSARHPQKEVRVLYSGAPVLRYRIFHHFEKIEWVDDVGNHLEGVDTLVTLDASNFARFSKFPEKLAAVPVRIGLDHHSSTPDDYTLLLLENQFAANTELIYRALLEGAPLTKESAEYILLGILGDTGNFSYVKPQRAALFLLAKELLETVGMPIDQFRSRYSAIPQRMIPLLQELVKNIRYETVDGWPPLQYTSLSRAVFEEGGYTDEDMSAASHIYMGQYLPRVEGYGWGFVITPRSDGGCRMSSRSLPGSVNVRVLHERMEIGSGHDRAAGGAFKEADPAACIALVLEWMKANEPLIG